MTIHSQISSDESLYLTVGLNLETAILPPARALSSKQISYLAIRIAGHFADNPPRIFINSGNHMEFVTPFYDLSVTGSLAPAVVAKSQSIKYWRKKIQYEADIARINYEAANRTVGGSLPGAQLYSSDKTVKKVKDKKTETQKYLASRYMVNTKTNDKVLLSDLAMQAAHHRFQELYWVAKNFEAIANEKNMGWLFVTYTAPPEYHPNPLKGKCSYDASLGVKASHRYILDAWARIRARLNSRGIKADINTYFGFRTAETHKDGAVHWHLLVFAASETAKSFIAASAEYFPNYGQMKVEVGDPKIGNAASYIFKYLAKGFDQSATKLADNTSQTKSDELREEADMASIRNGERVRAALKTMRVRQYQPFGVKNVMTLIRSINKLKEEDFASLTGGVGKVVKSKIWRNLTGLKYLLEHPKIFTKKNGVALLMMIREEASTVYGEKSYKVTGIKMGYHIISTQGLYKVENV